MANDLNHYQPSAQQYVDIRMRHPFHCLQHEVDKECRDLGFFQERMQQLESKLIASTLIQATSYFRICQVIAGFQMTLISLQVKSDDPKTMEDATVLLYNRLFTFTKSELMHTIHLMNELCLPKDFAATLAMFNLKYKSDTVTQSLKDSFGYPIALDHKIEWDRLLLVVGSMNYVEDNHEEDEHIVPHDFDHLFYVPNTNDAIRMELIVRIKNVVIRDNIDVIDMFDLSHDHPCLEIFKTPNNKTKSNNAPGIRKKNCCKLLLSHTHVQNDHASDTSVDSSADIVQSDHHRKKRRID